jgi:hypothetical protein
MKNKLVIDYEVKDDGRLYLDFKTSNGKINTKELLTVLTSSLSMTVKMVAKEMTTEEEGKMVRDILTFLSHDFFDNDSFKDLETFK